MLTILLYSQSCNQLLHTSEHGYVVPFSDHIRGLTVGTTALYVYDCMITLDREIDLIWMSPRRSSATYLFLSLRYSVLFANIYNLSAFIHMSDEVRYGTSRMLHQLLISPRGRALF